MKKITFLCSLLSLNLLSIEMQGQITITQADMPVVGSQVINAHDTAKASVSTLTPGGKGASVTWSYPALPRSYKDTDNFVNPSSTPYASKFPSSNLADSIYGTPGYTYLNSSVASFVANGTVQNIMGYNVAIALNPPFVQINFPGAYGNIDGGISTGKIPPTALVPPVSGFDSVKGSAYVKYADTIDAWGTITTDFNSYSALRQKHYDLNIDSLYVHSATFKTWIYYQRLVTKTYTYRWYANGIGDVLMQMQMDTTNTKVTAVQWYDGIPNGINELSQYNSVLTYPNPCSSQINFRYTDLNAQSISVFDITGRNVGGVEMKNGAATINTSSFANGMYLYRVLDKSGNVLNNGKFTVQQ